MEAQLEVASVITVQHVAPVGTISLGWKIQVALTPVHLTKSCIVSISGSSESVIATHVSRTHWQQTLDV